MKNLFKNSLKNRLIVAFLVVSLIPIAVLGYLSFNRARKAVVSSRMDALGNIADLKVNMIQAFFADQKHDIRIAQNYYNLKKNFPILNQYSSNRSHPAYKSAKAMLDRQLKDFQGVYKYKDIMLISPNGSIAYCSSKDHEEFELDTFLSDPSVLAFEKGKDEIYVSDVFRSVVHQEIFMVLITAPLYGFEGEFIGVIAFEILMSTIYEHFQDITGLGKSGEILIAKRFDDYAVFLNNLKYEVEAALTRKIVIGGDTAIPIQKAVNGLNGSGVSVDYRGEDIIAVWRYIPSLRWGLVAKVDVSEVFATIKSFGMSITWVVLAVFVIVVFVASLIARQISAPIIKFIHSTERITSGDLAQRIDTELSNEFGLLADSFNKMGEKLQAREEVLQCQHEELRAVNDELENNSMELLNANTKLVNEVNERKNIEKMLKKHQKSLIMLSGYEFSEERSLMDFTKITSLAIDVRYVSVWVLEEEGKLLRCLDYYDKWDDKHYIGMEISQNMYPRYFEAIDADGIVNADNALTDERTAELGDSYLLPKGIGAMLDVAFNIAGGRKGMLCNEHVGGVRKWQNYEMSFAVAVGEMLSLKFEQIQRKKVERELRLLNNAIEQSVDMVVITDADGIIQYVNPAVQKCTLYEPNEAIGGKPSFVKSGIQDEAFYKKMWNTIKQGYIWEGRLVNKKKSGVLYDEKMTISPIKDRNGIVTHFVAIKNDISELIARENELTEARSVAEHAAKELKETLEESEKLRMVAENAKEEALKYAKETEEANKIKSEFLANMSHELRTPLNGIIGMSEIVLKSTVTKEQKKNLGLILFSAKSLLSLVNDILDLSKIEEGKLQLAYMDFDLRDHVENIAQQQAYLAHKKGVEFIVAVNSNVPYFVSGDPDRLGEVLVNLIGNAIKFTEKGEILLGVELESSDENAIVVHFNVKDTGIGIPMDKLDKIFERFTQADSSVLRKFGGAGLGTTISRELVQLMGGKIWVESEDGKGSDFHCTVKFGVAKSVDKGVFYAPESFSGLKVLIVGDNKTNLKQLGGVIGAWGGAVSSVNSCDLAVNHLVDAQRKGVPFDILLIDCLIGRGGCIECIKKIRQIEGINDIKIVALASLGMENFAKCMEAGADDYLDKPVKQSMLYNIIQKAKDDDVHFEGVVVKDGPENIEGKGRKVLLVEDNIVNQEVAKAALKIMKHQFGVANNGKEAVSMWENGDYDLIMMDVHMPEMDGLEATRVIRNSERKMAQKNPGKLYQGIPIIAMTACAMEGDKEMCIAAGMDDYISKPISFDMLHEKLDKILNIDKHTIGNVQDNAAGGVNKLAVGKLQGDVVGAVAETVKVYDLTNLRMLLSDDEDSVKRLVRKFIESTSENIACLDKAISSGNCREVQHMAHTIKGAVSQMGAQELMEVAFDIEIMGKEGRLEDVPDKFVVLTKMYDGLCIGLKEEVGG